MKHLHIKEFVKTATSTKLAGTAEDNPESEESKAWHRLRWMLLMSSLIVDGLPPQAQKKSLSISFLGPLDEGMNDDLSYDWINLVAYAIGQNNFVETDKEEEERLQVEYDKEIKISYHLSFNWQKQDAITNKMDSNEYVDYTECRRVSFRES